MEDYEQNSQDKQIQWILGELKRLRVLIENHEHLKDGSSAIMIRDVADSSDS